MGVRVLIVEDDVTTQHVLRARLERIGCHVVDAVDNARDALDRFRELKPDLVTLDVGMPEVDDFDAVALFRQIRREDPNCDVVVISATAFPAYRERFAREGVLGYFKKPVNFDKLALDLRLYFPELKEDKPARAL